MVYGETISFQTKGNSDIQDITGRINDVIRKSGIGQGIVNVSVIGSTASVSTVEYEPALVQDVQECLERLISSRAPSRHSATWGDDNGFSHMRATLMGPGASFPVTDGGVLLGTWQQIIVIDHDNRPRNRQIRIQIIGE